LETEAVGGGPNIDWSFATRRAARFATDTTRDVFGPLVDAAMQKENEHRYGRPQKGQASP